jgi:hypothetical protein
MPLADGLSHCFYTLPVIMDTHKSSYPDRHYLLKGVSCERVNESFYRFWSRQNFWDVQAGLIKLNEPAGLNRLI